MQSKKLENLNCVVTGGTMGLGLAISNGFIEEGAIVTVCARHKSKELPSRTRFVCADVSKNREASRVIGMTEIERGPIDVVVCNAGIYGPIGQLDELNLDEWKECIEVNLYGVVHVCRAVAPHMKQRGRGKIIVVAGGGATQPMPNFSAYAASKAAVVRFAETLAMELAPFYIDVNSISPGALNTRFTDRVIESGRDKAGGMAYEKAVKQKKSGGDSVQRAVELAVYLASPESDGITGKLISAKWDNWESSLRKRCGEIMASDVYTLRRVQEPDSWSQ